MRKIPMAIMMICMAVAGLNMAAYCQDDSADDRIIDQSESQIGQNLDSEIGSEEGQAQSEVGQVDSAMNISGN